MSEFASRGNGGNSEPMAKGPIPVALTVTRGRSTQVLASLIEAGVDISNCFEKFDVIYTKVPDKRALRRLRDIDGIESVQRRATMGPAAKEAPTPDYSAEFNNDNLELMKHLSAIRVPSPDAEDFEYRLRVSQWSASVLRYYETTRSYEGSEAVEFWQWLRAEDCPFRPDWFVHDGRSISQLLPSYDSEALRPLIAAILDPEPMGRSLGKETLEAE